MSKETSALRVICFDRINKFVEDHSYHFIPLDSPNDNVTDTDDNSDLVADVDPDTLIHIVRAELKNGKAPGIDNVILKKAIGTGFLQYFGMSLYHMIKIRFYCICLEGRSTLYAHQAWQTAFTNY